MSDQPQTYRVIEAYISPYPDSTIFRKGDVVRIGEESTDDPDWKNWIWCEGADDAAAWVPRQYLHIEGHRGTLATDYDARELSVSVGEELLVYDVVNGFGIAKKPNGARGWVPMKVLQHDDRRTELHTD